LRLNVPPDGWDKPWDKQSIEVPCLPYEEVFHEEVVSSDIPMDESMFVRGLAELESLRTQEGAGLKAFLEQNLGQFDERVAAELRTLAEEVYSDAK
jgi:hypothetical protein